MASRARLVGFNHIALEVGDIEGALEFYGRLFEIELRGRGKGMAFIDAGDQFIALSEGRTQPPDDHRHIGMVVDDKRVVRRALNEAGVEILPGRGLDFRDPWGNRWQVVEYSEGFWLRDLWYTPHAACGAGPHPPRPRGPRRASFLLVFAHSNRPRPSRNAPSARRRSAGLGPLVEAVSRLGTRGSVVGLSSTIEEELLWLSA